MKITPTLLLMLAATPLFASEPQDVADRKKDRPEDHARPAQQHPGPVKPAPQVRREQPHSSPQVRHEQPRQLHPVQQEQPRISPKIRHEQSHPAKPLREPLPRIQEPRPALRQEVSKPEQRSQNFINRFSHTPSLSGMKREARPSAAPFSETKTPAYSKERFKSILQERQGHRMSPAERSQLKNEAERFIQKNRKSTGRDSKPQPLKALQEQRKRGHEGSRQANEVFRHEHPDHAEWFGDRFFESHHTRPYYHTHGARWWRRAGWNNIIYWLNWEGYQPIYYDYYGYPIEGYPAGGGEAYGGYPEQEEAVPSQGEWLSIGVFEAGSDEQDASYSDQFFQLAMSREGEIAGTYYNATSDETYQLDGSVIQDTQQAYWKMTGDPNSPLMLAGLYNLTEDSVPVQVLFADGRQQTWVFIRLNE